MRRRTAAALDLLTCALAAPLAVLLHELGHVGGYVALGRSQVRLHYASAEFRGEAEFWRYLHDGPYQAAAEIARPWHVGVGTAMGPLVTWIVVASAVSAWRRRPRPWLAALAIASAVRIVPILVQWVLGRAQGSDEARLALVTYTPEWPWMLAGVCALVFSLSTLIKPRPPTTTTHPVRVMVGAAFGLWLWLGLVGPIVLP